MKITTHKNMIIFCFLAFFGSISLNVNAKKPDYSLKECITKHDEGNKKIFTNNCEVTVSLLYCNKDKGFFGKRCGDNKEIYFSHLSAIDPHATKAIWHNDKVEYTSCYGSLNGSSVKKQFKAISPSKYSCSTQADTEMLSFDCGNTVKKYYLESMNHGVITYRFSDSGKLQLIAKRNKTTKNKEFNAYDFAKFACNNSNVESSQLLKLMKAFSIKSSALCLDHSKNKKCENYNMSIGVRG